MVRTVNNPADSDDSNNQIKSNSNLLGTTIEAQPGGHNNHKKLNGKIIHVMKAKKQRNGDAGAGGSQKKGKDGKKSVLRKLVLNGILKVSKSINLFNLDRWNKL